MSMVSKGPPPVVAEEAKGDAVEKDYVGLSEESSSSYPGGKGDDGGTEEEEEEDLELGLSLGAKKGPGGGGSQGGAPWREYCRILTAEDFPSRVSRASPLSSSSSVSSSPATLVGGGTAGGAASRKVAVSCSLDAAGSANPPPSGTQMVVGWPPIRAYRMNSIVNQSKDNTSSNAAVTTIHKKTNENSKSITKEVITKELEKKGGLARNSLFVKVNMDGDPIGRKVDLNAHWSYETLAVALEAMFNKPTLALGASMCGSRTSKLLDGSYEFSLTYEDKDGDWMLVGDVPWRMFLSTVKRLRIMRTSDTNGELAPRLRCSKSSGGLRNVP